LFCGAGGSAQGYYEAGFDVVGVDIRPQPRYPFEFVLGDALEELRDFPLGFDAVHASPPCQAYSTTRGLHTNEYPELVPVVRDLLKQTGLSYVIENVVGAPMTNRVVLCGSSFGLGVWRHRQFESNVMFWNPPACQHVLVPLPLDVTGGGPSKKPRTSPGGGMSRKPRNMAEASAAMGVDWMTRAELNEAIPPAYTKWIGEQLLDSLKVGAR